MSEVSSEVCSSYKVDADSSEEVSVSEPRIRKIGVVNQIVTVVDRIVTELSTSKEKSTKASTNKRSSPKETTTEMSSPKETTTEMSSPKETTTEMSSSSIENGRSMSFRIGKKFTTCLRV
jgi:hypothetical protein